MNNFALNFFLGLICTLAIFVLSIIITLGIKTLSLICLDLAKKSKNTQPKKAPAHKKPKQSSSKVIRSIEIDPEQIDKIYVKKTS